MSEAKFVCECDEAYRSACERLEFYCEVEGKKYCVLHCPALDKTEDFKSLIKSKLERDDYNFAGVFFPTDVSFQTTQFKFDANFSGARFNGGAFFEHASFSGVADFRGAIFSSRALFSSATFSGKASFLLATFSDTASFFSATFSNRADFYSVTFSGKTIFSSVTFISKADFTNAAFITNTSFSSAMIESYLRFEGTENRPVFAETESFDLHQAQITKAEQIIFHTVKLKPRWFVNVDSRKFEFTNIDWGRTTVRDDFKALENVENHHRLLSIAYRQLATNAEDNNRYSEAARFRYASMDARRLERWRGWDIFTLDWWYWLVSGYGERIPRAASCLLVLFLGFSFLYTKVGFETKAAPEVASIVQEMMPTPTQPKELPLPSFRDGLTYAMSAALFQRPEPKAYTFWAKTCVSLEMIFVPLQAALLALAIRRRFMR